MIILSGDSSYSEGETAVLAALTYMYEHHLGVTFIQHVSRYTNKDKRGIDFVVKTDPAIFPNGFREVSIQVKTRHRTTGFRRGHAGKRIAIILTYDYPLEQLVDILHFTFERPVKPMQLGGDGETSIFLQHLSSLYHARKTGAITHCAYLGNGIVRILTKTDDSKLDMFDPKYLDNFARLLDPIDLSNMRILAFKEQARRLDRIAYVLSKMKRDSDILSYYRTESTFVISPNLEKYPNAENPLNLLVVKTGDATKHFRQTQGQKIRAITVSPQRTTQHLRTVITFLLERPVPVVTTQYDPEYTDFVSLIQSLSYRTKNGLTYEYLGMGTFICRQYGGIFLVTNIADTRNIREQI